MKISGKYLNLIFYFFLILGITLTFYFQWWQNADHPNLYVPLLGFCIFFVTKLLRLNFSNFLIATFSIFYVNLHGIAPIASVAFLLLTSYSIGIKFTKFTNQYNFLAPLLEIGLGLSIIGGALIIFSHFKINYPIIYLLGFALINYLSAKDLDYSKLISYLSKNQSNSINSLNLIFAASTGVYFFLVTVLPEVGHDGVSTHLTIPKIMLERHEWSYNINEFIWSVQPLGIDLLYSPAFFFGGMEAVRLFNNVLLLFSALIIYKYSLSRGLSINLAFGISLAYFSIPLSFYVMGSTFVEPAFTFFLTLSFSLLLIKNRSWEIFFAIFGFACSARFSAFLLAPFIGVYFLHENYRAGINESPIKKNILIIIIFLIFSGINYFYAYWLTSNPVFPLLNHIFKSEYFDTAVNFNPTWIFNLGISKIWLMTFNSGMFGDVRTDGAIGILYFVITPTALLILLWHYKQCKFELYLLLTTLLVGYLLFSTQSYLRYIFPIASFIVLIFIAVLGKTSANLKLISVGFILISLLNLLRMPIAATYLPLDNPKLYLSKLTFNNYFIKERPYLKVGEILSQNPDYQNKRILLVGPHYDPAYYYYPSRTIAYSWHSLDFFVKFHQNNADLKKTVNDIGIDLVVCPLHKTEADIKYNFSEQCRNISDKEFTFGDVYVGKIKKN